MSNSAKTGIVVGLPVFLMVAIACVLLNSSVIADNKMRNGNEVSCTLSYSAGDNHEVTMINGTYQDGIGTIDFGADCSDDAGFVMYTAGFSKNMFGNNKMIGYFVDGYDSEFDIESGAATSGDTSNWAMKVNKLSGEITPDIENGFGSYRAVPNEYTRMISFDESTNDSPLMFRISYAVFVSDNQMVGTYTGKVRYTLVHPQNAEAPLHPEVCPGDGNICYIPNAKNVVGKIAAQNATIGENTLRTSNFKRAGYGFAGWNTEYDYSGTTYGPNETITISDYLDEAGLPLYAVWVKSSGSLQNWNGCYELSVGDVIALTDQRDNQTYAISKLADGKCWMIENLRLSDDANNEAMSQGYGGKFAGLPESQYSEEFRDDATSYNSLYYYDIDELDDYHGEATINIGSDDYPSTRLPRYNSNNTTWQADTAEEPTNNYFGYGHYYNWPAAIANTSFFGNNNTRTTTSICPTGWRLPMGGDKNGESVNEYWNLIVKSLNNNTLPSNYGAQETPYYSGNTETKTASELIRAYPNNFIKSGKYEGGDHVDPGDSGMYWSSISGQNEVAYGLYFDETSLYPGTKTEAKYNGGTIRCITTPEEYRDVIVHFDSGVSSIVFHSDEFGEQEATTNGATVSIAKNAQYTIWATYSADNRGANTWTTTSSGVLDSATSAVTTYAVSDDAELSLTSKEVCPADKICYQRNDTANGTLNGAMGQQSIGGTDAVLMASNYSNTEYGFAGWNTAPDGSGTYYGPNETIHYASGAYSRPYNGLTLYAMWVPSVGYLQNWYCPSEDKMPIGTVTALTDYRDNQVYAVAKLADGKCWMIENMRLESENTVGNSINNSNITNQSLAQGYASSSEYGNFIGLANAEQSDFNTNGNSNSIYGTDIGSIIDIGHIDASAYRVPRYNNTNTLARASEPTDNTENIYSYGNYYTWHAAIADTAYYGVDNKNLDETSICPAGWELPTGGSAYVAGSMNGVNVTGDESTYRDYYNLGYHLIGATAYENNSNNGHSYYSASTGEIFRKYPNNFLYSGVYYDSSAQDRGTSAYYWTATSSGNDVDAYQLSISQDVRPGTDNVVTYKGAAIRCINDNTAKSINGLEYMQDFANLSAQELEVVKSNMIEDEQYLIKDSRDNKEYFISKLADGNIWMTQDLDHDIVTTPDYYTYENTDIGHGAIKDTNATWTASTATYETGDTTWINDGDGNNIPQSYDPGNVIWDGVPDERWYTTLDNMVQGFESHYRIGNYYDWTAAIAMNDSSSYTSGEIDQSICPAGWTLPRAGFDDEAPGTFDYLIKQYGYDSSTLHMDDPHPWEAPLYYAYGGYWRGYSDLVAAFAYYWSSTVNSPRGANNMSADSGASSIAPSASYSRSDGLNVRCIARTPAAPPMSINDLEYMQDFASLDTGDKADVLDSMTRGEQYQLTDSRDDKVYYISKLADGNVWMTQNLDHDIVTTPDFYTYDNTDIGHGAVRNENATWTAPKATYATGDTTWDTSSAVGTLIPESYDPGDLCWNGVLETDTSGTISSMTTSCTDRHYHMGNYYKWIAAVALSSGDSLSGNQEDLDQSICPAGWTLPKDGMSTGSGTYAYLVNQANLTSGTSGNIHLSPYFFVYGGAWYGYSMGVGIGGLYWSSVTDSPNDAHMLLFESDGYLYEYATDGRTGGDSIRCVVR